MEAILIELKNKQATVMTEYGMLRGNWHSSSSEEKKYIIELDSNDVVNLSDIRLSNERKSRLICKKDFVHICGMAEEIENDMLFLRIGKDLMMVMVREDVKWFDYIGKYIYVTFHNINLYTIT